MEIALVNINVLAQSFAQDKPSHFFELWVSFPLSPIVYVLGTALPWLPISLLTAGVTLAAGILLFGIHLTISPVILVLSLVLVWSSTTGIGYLVAVYGRTPGQVNQLAQFVGVMMTFFAPIYYPVTALPLFAQYIAYARPLSWGAILLKAIFLSQTATATLANGVLSLYTVVGFALIAGGLDWRQKWPARTVIPRRGSLRPPGSACFPRRRLRGSPRGRAWSDGCRRAGRAWPIGVMVGRAGAGSRRLTAVGHRRRIAMYMYIHMNADSDVLEDPDDTEGGVRVPSEGEAKGGELLEGDRSSPLSAPPSGRAVGPLGDPPFLDGRPLPIGGPKKRPRDPGRGAPVRCLDTPLLEDLLLGRGRAHRWVERLEGGSELATTEVNLYELTEIARRWTPRAGLRRRLQALEEIRRALTVLPLGPEGVRRAGGLLQGGQKGPSDLVVLMSGICLAQGVDELYTSRGRRLPRGLHGLKVVRV